MAKSKTDTKRSLSEDQLSRGAPQLSDERAPEVVEEQGAEGATSAKPKTNPRRGAIRYSNGIGWSDATQTWWVHVRSGKSTFTRDTGKRNRRDAESWLLNFRRAQAVLTGADYIPHLTVEEGLRLWVANVTLEPMRSRPPSEGHIENVKRAYELHVIPQIGRKEIERLQKSDLLDLVSRYKEGEGPHGLHDQGGPRNFIITLNIPLRWLLKTERVSRLPRLPMIPKMERKIPIIVPLEHFEELLRRYDRYVQYDLYAMIYIRVMALVGLRTTNARDLLKSQFRNGLSQLATGITKNGVEYLLPAPKDIQELLKHVPSMEDAAPLFPAPYARKRRSEGWCLEAFRRAAKDIGMTEKVAWHRLRATYASALVQMGADMFVLKELMGWETLAVAARYVNTSSSRLVSAQGSAADLLTGRGRDGREGQPPDRG
ncbi:tyrosine-type recombinase/integrase [Geothrix edaphica]|uniref:Tyr recombinase domain-containing protein n=1 Tax=Geothrix edaphica TaxID=2927976 RepID=A0ABQ5PV44_9BACT|nr:site-specific integrase [Geothrix edaphica]GLH66000.1 hypothetical protein GETHED_03640 [Geothrix edaphica]